jgi:ATP-dependent Clp protease adaptor protein ClpS
MPRPKRGDGGDLSVVVEKKSKTSRKKPRQWKVILHNDDYTTMEFVIAVLVQVFHHQPPAAEQLTMEVHERGACVAGVYTREVAETKVDTVERLARAAEFPFLATMEPEEPEDADGKETRG